MPGRHDTVGARGASSPHALNQGWAGWGFAGAELVVWLAVFCFAIHARRDLIPLPISDFDTWGYLHPAISWLGGEGFQQTFGRDWLYPGFIAAVLNLSHSFTTLFYVQMAIGLGTIFVMAAAWRTWARILHLPPEATFIVTICGAVPVFLHTSNPNTILLEWSLRPEAIFPFFAFGQIATLLACLNAWSRSRAQEVQISAASCVLASGICYLLKPSWILASAAAVLVVTFLSLGRPGPLAHRLLGVGIGGVIAVLALLLPGKLFMKPDAMGTTFLPGTILTIHADLIAPVLAKKAAALPDGEPQAQELKRLSEMFSRELEVSRGLKTAYTRLGFDPDHIFYETPVLDELQAYFEHRLKEYRAFCFRLYFQALLEQPVAMARKVFSQMHYFAFPSADSFYAQSVSLRHIPDLCEQSLISYRDWVAHYGERGRDLYFDFLEASRMASWPAGDLKGYSWAAQLSERWAKASAYIVICFLAAFLASAVWRPLRCLRSGGAAALIVYFIVAANALLVSAVHAMDVVRYRVTLGAFLPFALAMLLVFTIAVFGKFLVSVDDEPSA